MLRPLAPLLAPLLAAMLAAALVLGAVLAVERAERQRFAEESRARVTAQAAAVRARLEQALNARLFLVRGLAALVRADPEITQDRFAMAAQAALEGLSGVRGVGLARGAVISHVHPLETNRGTLGHDLLADPERREAVLEVYRNRTYHLQGPLPLIQGGTGLVGRMPVTLPPVPGKDTSGEDAVWGLAVVLLDLEPVLREAGLPAPTVGGMEFALRGRDAKGAAGATFFGRSELFAADSAPAPLPASVPTPVLTPVLTDVTLPNGSWQLAAWPAGGWDSVRPDLTYLYGLGGLLAVASAGLAWRLAGDPVRLRRAAAEARHRMRESERQFSLLVDGVEDYAILMLSPDGMVASWNNGARRILGYADEEIVGRNYAAFFPPEEVAAGRPAADLEEARRPGRSARERWRVRRDGSRFRANTVITAIRDEDGRLCGFSEVTRDLTELVRTESELRESNQRFRDIADVAGEYVWEIDPAGRFTFLSDRVQSTLGYQPAELIGHTLFELMPVGEAARMTELFREHIARRSAFQRLEHCMIGKDGRLVWQWGNGMPVLDASGELLGFRGTCLDITRQKETEQALRKSVDMLRRSNAELERFAQIVAHDLQEPLRMVVSYAHLLERRYRGRLDADADEFIGYMVDGSVRMKSLLQDLLRYSTLDQGDLPAQRADTAACWRAAAQRLRDVVARTRARVEVEGLPEVVGDDRQLALVFHCLLANALEYHAPERPPVVRATARAEGGMWEFAVADNGIGIEPQYFERIFAIFQRLHGPRRHPGTGVGLAICKKIVERHGGRLWVESTPGQGSTFRFTLPIRELPPASPPPAAEPWTAPADAPGDVPPSGGHEP